MKKILLGLVLMITTTAALALLPPQYLSVDKWKSCTSTMQQGSASFVCLPAKRPRGCPRSSWQQLLDLNELQPCLLR